MIKNIKGKLLIIVGISLLALVWYLQIGGEIANKTSINVLFACKDNKTINAVISEKFPRQNVGPEEMPIPNGQAHIELSDGRILDLNQTISASGVRYANIDESFVFWTKGNGALVLEGNREKSYIGCILVKDKPKDSNLNQVYVNNELGFSLRHPGYRVDDEYAYSMSPTQQIHGVRLLIPDYLKEGTNLSSDSYISVEAIPREHDCRAELFLERNNISKEITENQITYSVASSSGAGAGNRYEETIYAFPGTNPCLAMRYYIHYSAIQNYDPGVIKEFNKEALLQEFDLIRSTLVINN